MTLLDRIRSFFQKEAAVEPATVEPEPRYPPESRTPFEDPDIKALLPEGYRVEFVKNSQSALHLDPDHWATGAYADRNLWNNSGVFSIEVLSRYGKPVAAVGWEVHETWDGEPSDTAKTFGTFVASHLRQRGLGKALWKAMIRVCGKPKVHGSAASDHGYTLLHSMKEAFPDVVTFDGEQKYSLFTDLRKGRAA
jgi:GNAT superfamily N-acetyltransferase